MKTLAVVGLTIVGVVVTSGLAGYVYLSEHTFTARQKPPAFESALARVVRSISTPPESKTRTNPVPLTQEALAEGMHHYAVMCTDCHGADGHGNTETAEGLYPPVPDLQGKGTQSLTDGVIYYVIKNGIPFSGMPAWDEEEQTYWDLVHFVRHLPVITKSEIENVEKISRATDSDEHE